MYTLVRKRFRKEPGYGRYYGFQPSTAQNTLSLADREPPPPNTADNVKLAGHTIRGAIVFSGLVKVYFFLQNEKVCVLLYLCAEKERERERVR